MNFDEINPVNVSGRPWKRTSIRRMYVFPYGQRDFKTIKSMTMAIDVEKLKETKE